MKKDYRPVLKLRTEPSIDGEPSRSLCNILTTPKDQAHWGISPKELDELGLVPVSPTSGASPTLVYHQYGTDSTIRIGTVQREYSVVEIYGRKVKQTKERLEKFADKRGLTLHVLEENEKGLMGI